MIIAIVLTIACVFGVALPLGLLWCDTRWRRKREAAHQIRHDEFCRHWYARHPDGKPVPPSTGIGDRAHGWEFYPRTKSREELGL